MNPGSFSAIFPSTLTGSMLIMISSMSSDANSPAMQIINSKYDDGTDVVKKFNFATSCGVCTRKGIAEKCTHISRSVQHFQSIGAQARLSKLLSADDYLREVMYVSFSLLRTHSLTHSLARNQVDAPLITYAFDRPWIENMVNNPYRLNEDIEHLFITIDPASGKDQNLYVLCSTVFTKDRTCVVCPFLCPLTHSLQQKHVVRKPGRESLVRKRLCLCVDI